MLCFCLVYTCMSWLGRGRRALLCALFLFLCPLSPLNITHTAKEHTQVDTPRQNALNQPKRNSLQTIDPMHLTPPIHAQKRPAQQRLTHAPEAAPNKSRIELSRGCAKTSEKHCLTHCIFIYGNIFYKLQESFCTLLHAQRLTKQTGHEFPHGEST